MDGMHADGLRGLRLREPALRTQGAQALSKPPPFTPRRRDERRPVPRLGASVPEG
jgi:hypothetical protein